jgi:hypothetical protein
MKYTVSGKICQAFWKVVDQIGKPRAPKHWKDFLNLTVYVPELEYPTSQFHAYQIFTNWGIIEEGMSKEHQ